MRELPAPDDTEDQILHELGLEHGYFDSWPSSGAVNRSTSSLDRSINTIGPSGDLAAGIATGKRQHAPLTPIVPTQPELGPLGGMLAEDDWVKSR